MLSRSDIWKSINSATIPTDELEILAQGAAKQLPKGTLISPEALHQLATREISTKLMTKCPVRKSNTQYVRFPFVSIEEMFNSKTNEEQILEVILGGKTAEERYSKIKPNSSAFSSPKQKKLISIAEFKKKDSKYRFDEIRASLLHIKTHIDQLDVDRDEFYLGRPGDDVDEEKLGRFQALVDHFIQTLKSYLERTKVSEQQPTLYKLVQACRADLTRDKFADLVDEYQKSPLYNTQGEFKYELCSFVFIQHGSSDIWFEEGNKGELLVKTHSQIVVEPYKALILKLDFTLSSDQMSQLVLANENLKRSLDLYVEETRHGRVQEYFFMGLYNNSERPVVLEVDDPVVKLQLRGNVCSCPIDDHCFILESKESDNQHQTVKFMLNAISATLLDLGLADMVRQTVELNGVAVTALQAGKMVTEKEDKQAMDKSTYNLVVGLNEFFTNSQVYSPELVARRQSLCPALMELKKQAEGGSTSRYKVKDGLLFMEDKEGPYKFLVLCLDTDTMKFLAKSLHNRGYHFSEKVVYTHLKRYFWCTDMKKIIREVSQSCVACFFGQPSHKQTYIHNQPEESQSRVYETLYVDLAESFPRDRNGYQFVAVLVDRATNYVMTISLRSKTSFELAQQFDRLFGNLTAPREIISDYGPCFKGSFRKMARKYDVQMNKAVPRRPVANTSEVYIKLFRNYFTKYLLSVGKDSQWRWSELLPLATCIFNSSITHCSRGNNTSPAELFFHPSRFNSAKLITMVTNPELEEYRRKAGLKRIFDNRNRNREGYKGTQISDMFKVGQVVCRVLQKNELPSRSRPGGVSLPEKGNISGCHIILSKTKTGLRCRSLVEPSEFHTFQYGEVKPIRLDSKMLHGLLLTPRIQDSFSKGLFRSQKGDTLLQHIADSRKFIEDSVKNGAELDAQAARAESDRVEAEVFKEHGVPMNTAGYMQNEEDQTEESGVEPDVPADATAEGDVEEGDEPVVDDEEIITEREAPRSDESESRYPKRKRVQLEKFYNMELSGGILKLKGSQQKISQQKKSEREKGVRFDIQVKYQEFHSSDAANVPKWEGLSRLKMEFQPTRQIKNAMRRMKLFLTVTRLTGPEYIDKIRRSKYLPARKGENVIQNRR